MSPSGHWDAAKVPPLFEALAAAQHAAWRVDPDRRRTVFIETFRKAFTPARAEAALTTALQLFQQQLEPPTGYEDRPGNLAFELCPRCEKLRGTQYAIAPSGRTKMNALRDKEWLSRQFDRGLKPPAVAKRLQCSAAMVQIWADKHGLDWRGKRRHHPLDAEVQRRFAAGQCPGTMAEALDETINHVRRTASRLKLANMKEGWPYHTKQWWIERIVNRQWTTRQCAAEAGIRPNGCAYWLKQFGLQDITIARSLAHLGHRKPKYPELADPAKLRALMEEHGNYEAVARAIGAPKNTGSNVRSWWFIHFPHAPPSTQLRRRSERAKCQAPHHAREWWTTRLNTGATQAQLAEESGLAVKTVQEKLRLLGTELLTQSYHNNTAAARTHRRPA